VVTSSLAYDPSRGRRGGDRVQKIAWVGSTDLDVEFVVTVIGSAGPIPSASPHLGRSLSPARRSYPRDDPDGCSTAIRARRLCHGRAGNTDLRRRILLGMAPQRPARTDGVKLGRRQ